MQLSSSLEALGIVLLELCFGELLEEQPYRTKHSNSGCDPIERIFDVAAAKEWHGEVEEDAGYEYAVAVGWCWVGYSARRRISGGMKCSRKWSILLSLSTDTCRSA